MRDFLQWRTGDAIMLAEANVPPDESMKYFGDEGERIQMMLNFPVNQRLFYALATADLDPLIWALEQTCEAAGRTPSGCSSCAATTSSTSGASPRSSARRCSGPSDPKKRMQLYDRGIRRRLAPMLGNDRRRLELAFSLLFSLPGTPMMQYGDEIGMGDNLRLPERECARTPMQWTSEPPHGGFSRAKKVVRPVIDDPVYGYRKVNVAEQRRHPQSLLNWTERMIRMRKECPEISWGNFTVLRPNVPEVLALRYDWRGTSLVTLHNFSDKKQKVALKVGVPRDRVLVEVFDGRHSRRLPDGFHRIDIEEHAWRWFRVGAADNALDRSDLELLPKAKH